MGVNAVVAMAVPFAVLSSSQCCNPVPTNSLIHSQVNLMLTPVNLATLIPLQWLGCWVIGVAPAHVSVDVLTNGWSDPKGTMRLFGAQFIYGIMAWVLLAPVLVGGSFLVLRPATTFFMGRPKPKLGTEEWAAVQLAALGKEGQQETDEPDPAGGSTGPRKRGGSADLAERPWAPAP